MCDIQEADSYEIKWEGPAPSLRTLYLGVMDQFFQINTGVPFMVQGTGQAAVVNWGDGFVTDYTTINSRGLSDPNIFFQMVLQKPYLRQVGHD